MNTISWFCVYIYRNPFDVVAMPAKKECFFFGTRMHENVGLHLFVLRLISSLIKVGMTQWWALLTSKDAHALLSFEPLVSHLDPLTGSTHWVLL